MKKFFALPLIVLFMAGCDDQKKYEAAVLNEVTREQANQDAKDLKFPAQDMAECIVRMSSEKMPGFFPFDPQRLTAYRNYTKMLTLTQSPDPRKTLEELRTDFGSAKEVTAARANYTESEMECLSEFVVATEQPEQSSVNK